MLSPTVLSMTRPGIFTSLFFKEKLGIFTSGGNFSFSTFSFKSDFSYIESNFKCHGDVEKDSFLQMVYIVDLFMENIANRGNCTKYSLFLF